MEETYFGCGCTIIQELGHLPNIVYCPKHTAAGDLLAACEKQQTAILALIQEWDLWEMLGALDRTIYQDALDKGRAAIAKTKGDQC